LASSSDFTAIFFLFQIFYSSVTFFTSIVLSFFVFLFFFLSFSLFCFFSSHLFPSSSFYILPSTSYSSPLVAYALVFKIQRMKLENETQTTMKPAKALQACGYFFICNLISIQ